MAKLNLSRDQLSTFLKNHEQIKQFEALFSVVDAIAPDVVQAVSIQAGNAEASANDALTQIANLAQDVAVNVGASDQKAIQALDALNRIAQALEMIATAPAVQHNNSIVTDYIDLPEIGPHLTRERRVQWNRDDGTMDVGLYGGSVLQVGQEIHYYAKNTSGATITNGTPVMFTGAVGASGKLTFGKAVADGSVLADYMMGVATQDIANNTFGYVTSFGLVRGFDTTGTPYGEVWANGDLLYFDPATPGTWTNVQPAAPSIGIAVGVVVNAASGGAGSIFVRMHVDAALSKLQDVFISGGTPTNNDILIYDAADSRWENRAPVAARDALGLGTGTPTNGQLLIGNGTDFTTANLTAGSNVTITNGAGTVTIAATSASPFGASTTSGANAANFSGLLPTGTAASTNTWAQVTISGTNYWVPIWAK